MSVSRQPWGEKQTSQSNKLWIWKLKKERSRTSTHVQRKPVCSLNPSSPHLFQLFLQFNICSVNELQCHRVQQQSSVCVSTSQGSSFFLLHLLHLLPLKAEKDKREKTWEASVVTLNQAANWPNNYNEFFNQGWHNWIIKKKKNRPGNLSKVNCLHGFF